MTDQTPVETAAEKIRFALLDTLGGCNLNVPPAAASPASDITPTLPHTKGITTRGRHPNGHPSRGSSSRH